MNKQIDNKNGYATPRKPLPKLKVLTNTNRLAKNLGGQDVGMTLTCRVTLNLCNTKPCAG